MCYPLQGPRCSYHAFNEYIEASNRYQRCTDPSEKIELGKILEEKTKLYYATPRGQNGLKREYEAAEGLAKENFKVLLEQGAKLREAQLETYRINKERRSTLIKEMFNQQELSTLKMTRYSTATAIVYSFLLDRLPQLETTIINDNAIEIQGVGKLLVLPNKYQKLWTSVTRNTLGAYSGENIKLTKILNSKTMTGSILQQELFAVAIPELEEAGYVGVALVNIPTEDVFIAALDTLSKTHEIKYKLSKRLGGTTKYYGDLSKLRELLTGTVFEKADLMSVEATRSTILLNAPLTAPKDRKLSDEFYLGLRHSASGDYYEVRRRHNSSNYNVFINLRAKRTLNISGFDKKTKELLTQLDNVEIVQLEDNIVPTTELPNADIIANG